MSGNSLKKESQDKDTSRLESSIAVPERSGIAYFIGRIVEPLTNGYNLMALGKGSRQNWNTSVKSILPRGTIPDLFKFYPWHLLLITPV